MGIAAMKKQQKKSPQKPKSNKHKRPNTPWFGSPKRDDANGAKRLTAEMIKNCEYIMSLPHEKRWNAGSKDWGFYEREYAKKIELNRIRKDTAWCGAPIYLV